MIVQIRTAILTTILVGLAIYATIGESEVTQYAKKLDMLYSVATVFNTNTGFGSAVVVFSSKESNYSLLLTARHNLQDLHIGDLTVSFLPDGRSYGAAVVKQSDKYDLAVLRVDVYHPHVAERASHDEPLLFTEVWKIGAGLTGIPHPAPGVVNIGGDMMFSVSAPIIPGDSGGGIFYQDGSEYKLIGIMISVPLKAWPVYRDNKTTGAFVLTPATHLGLSYNMQVIREFLET